MSIRIRFSGILLSLIFFSTQVVIGVYTFSQRRYIFAFNYSDEKLTEEFGQGALLVAGSNVFLSSVNKTGVKENMSVEEKVLQIVSEQLQVPSDEVNKESLFVEDLKADSLDIVEMVMEFEDAFDVTIPDDDYDKIKTVGDAVNYIEEKS